jgi:putative two-component system response regulator
LVGKLRVSFLTASGSLSSSLPIAKKLIGKAVALHDVGKIFIPADILLKPVPLSPIEYEAVKAHTLWGAIILSSLPHGPVRKFAVNISAFHHEKWDGTGYWGAARRIDSLIRRILLHFRRFKIVFKIKQRKQRDV